MQLTRIRSPSRVIMILKVSSTRVETSARASSVIGMVGEYRAKQGVPVFAFPANGKTSR